MKYLIILLSLFIVSIGFSQINPIATDSSYIVPSHNREAIETIKTDSAYFTAEQSQIAQDSALLLRQLDRRDNAIKKAKLIRKSINYHKRNIAKAKKRGVQKFVKKESSDDEEEPFEASGISLIQYIKSFASAEELADEYKRVAGLRNLASLVGIKSTGNKSVLSKRLFDHVQ